MPLTFLKIQQESPAKMPNQQQSDTQPKVASQKIQTAGEPSALHHVKFRLSALVDKGIYVIAALGPLSAFDQVWQIWVTGNKSGVSLVMWLSWIPGAIFWLSYGILHRDKPIMLTQTLWLIMQITIVAGLLWKS